MVHVEDMLGRYLLVGIALGFAGCAQIAGFERRSVADTPPNESEAGAPSEVGGSSAQAGSSSGALNGGGSGSTGGSSVVEPVAGEGPSGGGTSNGAGGQNMGATSGTAPAGGSASGSGGAAGTSSTAGTAGTGDDEVVGGCNAEQLKNAAFDRGVVAWEQKSNAPGITDLSDVILHESSSRLAAVNVAPESDQYLAWLGNIPNSDKGTYITLSQPIQIPAKVAALKLSGWLRIRTLEPTPANSNDQIDLAIDSADPDDERYWSFHFWRVDEGDATDKWTHFEYTADDSAVLDALRGQTKRFKAETQSDEQGQTTFWLDSLSLIAVCP